LPWPPPPPAAAAVTVSLSAVVEYLPDGGV